MVKGLEGRTYKVQQRVGSAQRRLRGNFIAVYNFLKSGSREAGAISGVW